MSSLFRNISYSHLNIDELAFIVYPTDLFNYVKKNCTIRSISPAIRLFCTGLQKRESEKGERETPTKSSTMSYAN